MAKKPLNHPAAAWSELAAPLQFPPVTTELHNGVLTLHLGSSAIQGAMRLAVPDQIELEYVQQMMMWLLFKNDPEHIVQLGLGAASLTKYCYRYFQDARITAVELNPAVIELCRQSFKLAPDDQRLAVLNMDALDFVHAPKMNDSIDILQVDLYDAAAESPALGGAAFYQRCADILKPDGMLTVNLFGSPQHYRKNCDAHIEAMQQAFDAVVWLPLVHDANTVALAFKQAPAVDFEQLYQRAAAIRAQYKLPAAKWVKGLQAWMKDQLEAD